MAVGGVQQWKHTIMCWRRWPIFGTSQWLLKEITLMPALTEINSLQDLAEIVLDWERRLNEPMLGLPTFWFRGHADASWELKPTVLRSWFVAKLAARRFHASLDPDEDLEANEITFNREFRRMAASFHLAGDSDVELYFLQQHHGMPTRLLDWSRNAMAALFFAVSEHDDREGELFVMDPRRTLPTTIAGIPKDVVHARHPIVENTVKYLYEGSPSSPNPFTPPGSPYVIPVSPDLRAGRLLQQDACFTLHMPRSSPLQIEPGVIETYRVPSGRKEELRFLLRSMGIGYAHIYADLDNVSRDIRSAWKLYP